jgi:hypothetical protein
MYAKGRYIGTILGSSYTKRVDEILLFVAFLTAGNTAEPVNSQNTTNFTQDCF